MSTAKQRKYWRETMRAYRKRTNNASDKRYYQKHHASIMIKEESYRKNNKPTIKRDNARRIAFKGKRVFLSKIPRTGICSKCKRSVQKNEIDRTALHHQKYDVNNAHAHTVELCASCHRIEHNGGVLSMNPSAIQMRNYRARKISLENQS